MAGDDVGERNGHRKHGAFGMAGALRVVPRGVGLYVVPGDVGVDGPASGDDAWHLWRRSRSEFRALRSDVRRGRRRVDVEPRGHDALAGAIAAEMSRVRPGAQGYRHKRGW